MFGSLFTKQNQKPGETVEDFAAALKRLHDKAHPGRDKSTRQEDLLCRFLEGIQDREAALQVEFMKAHANIDNTVKEVVLFQHVHKPNKLRSARIKESDQSEEEYNSAG